jgi:cytochrome c oxidase subunit II
VRAVSKEEFKQWLASKKPAAAPVAPVEAAPAASPADAVPVEAAPAPAPEPAQA